VTQVEQSRLSAARQRQPSARRGASRSWLWAVVVIGIPAVVGALGLVNLVRAASHLSTARQAIQAAQTDVQAGRLNEAGRRLAVAEKELTSGTLIVHKSASLNLLGILPVAHQNLEAIKRSVSLALVMTNGGRRLVELARPLEGPNGRIEVPLNSGAIPLDKVVAMRDQLDELSFALPGGSEAPGTALLVGKVGSLQRDVYREAAARRRQFTSVARALDVLADMGGANGPRRYLVAVANAAEMRGTGGMILSYGVLTSADGKFKLDHFGQIDELKLTSRAPVDPAPPYVQRFKQLDPTLLWRNANVGADFTQAGPVLDSMYTAATGQPVDGVIQIDSMGLSALLRALGPVNVPDLGQVNADNAVALTLNEAYTRFPNRTVRQEYLGQVAQAAFQRLVTGAYPSLRSLGESLATAVRRRNIIVYSTRPSTERSIGWLQADGSVASERDFLQLTVQNFTGNKLDYYVDSEVRLTGSRPEGKQGRVRAEVRLTDTAPPNGQPPYVFGPLLPQFAAGEYRTVVSLYVPAGTAIARSAGLDQPFSLVLGAEDARSVVSFTSNLRAGETRIVTVDLVLPPRAPSAYSLSLLPSPRVRPTVFVVDLDTGGGHRARYRGPLPTPATVR
jgi:hypothetical protein